MFYLLDSASEFVMHIVYVVIISILKVIAVADVASYLDVCFSC